MTGTATRTRTITATPTATLPVRGPIVTYFGVLGRIDGCTFCCEESCQATPSPTPRFDPQGREIFDSRNGQFLIVVEGTTGASGVPPGDSLMPTFDGRGDLQIQSTVSMGNGSGVVCDTGAPPAGGGIPGINPPSYEEGNSFVTDALNDFACRFQALDRTSPCTRIDATGDTRFIHPFTLQQFCNAVAVTTAFPPGEALLTVRLRDENGNPGPTKQVVVRVATFTPTRTSPTRTPSRTPTRRP
jgi:hypothetical protein